MLVFKLTESTRDSIKRSTYAMPLKIKYVCDEMRDEKKSSCQSYNLLVIYIWWSFLQILPKLPLTPAAFGSDDAEIELT